MFYCLHMAYGDDLTSLAPTVEAMHSMLKYVLNTPLNSQYLLIIRRLSARFSDKKASL